MCRNASMMAQATGVRLTPIGQIGSLQWMDDATKQCNPLGQRSGGLKGGEYISLIGMVGEKVANHL